MGYASSKGLQVTGSSTTLASTASKKHDPDAVLNIMQRADLLTKKQPFRPNLTGLGQLSHMPKIGGAFKALDTTATIGSGLDSKRS